MIMSKYSIQDLVEQALKSVDPKLLVGIKRENNYIDFGKFSDSLMNATNNKGVLSSAGGIVQLDPKNYSKEKPKYENIIKDSDIYDGKKLETSLKKSKEKRKETLGKGWFDMEPIKVEGDLLKDVQIIQMRNIIDPKRFYKNPDKIKNIVGVGTVIEGPSEYKNARLTKKERKTTIVDEILHDTTVKSYSKRVYAELQDKKSNYKKTYKDKHGNRKPKKQAAYY